jgi:hypothetical protein
MQGDTGMGGGWQGMFPSSPFGGMMGAFPSFGAGVSSVGRMGDVLNSYMALSQQIGIDRAGSPA